MSRLGSGGLRRALRGGTGAVAAHILALSVHARCVRHASSYRFPCSRTTLLASVVCGGEIDNVEMDEKRRLF